MKIFKRKDNQINMPADTNRSAGNCLIFSGCGSKSAEVLSTAQNLMARQARILGILDKFFLASWRAEKIQCIYPPFHRQ
jgi:hypothetical protein